MRTWWIAIGILISASATHAQDAGTAAEPVPEPEPEPVSEPVPDAPPAADAPPPADAPAEAADAPPGGSPASPAETPRVAPKIAVVVAGDPDPVLTAAAREIEARAAASEGVRLPSDPALRAALRGEPATAGDGLDEVRRERSRLGLGESSDAPILQRLGRRAGAVAVVVVRATAEGAEAVVLDVRAASFFEGSLAMTAPDPDAIEPFVARRARLAARASVTAGDAVAAPLEQSTAEEGPAAAGAAPGATEAAEGQGQDAGQWFEQNWPYFAAGALLVAAVVFVAVTATEGGPPPPVLRFQPGTP